MITIVRRTRSKRQARKPTKEQAKQIRALKQMKDEDIDFSDIPPLTGNEKFVVGKFYRPIKKSLTIRIDADVLAWIKAGGKGYQTRINSYLREAMLKKRARSAGARKKRSAS